MTAGSRLRHRHTVNVARADIDELGHVNNAVYLRYVEDVARAHSASVGLTLACYRELEALPVVRRHLITYRAPARSGDQLEVSMAITSLGGIRATRHNEVRCVRRDALLVEVDTEWVWLDPQTFRPRRIPRKVLDAFRWPDK